MTHCYIIAEAGVNHNGDMDMALELIEVAARAGADAVKFQTFKSAALINKQAEKADYQKQTSGADESQYAMLKRLELKPEDHHQLIAHCEQHGIQFLSTPFDLGSLDFLLRELDLPLLKMASGEIINGPLLLAAAQSGKDLILSTGMSTLAEIEAALKLVLFGYLEPAGAPPDAAQLDGLFADPGHQQLLRDRVSLLHCTTEYPAPYADVNLRAIDTLREQYGLRTGFSDHTQGIHIPIAAVARGAQVIEKHFTLDNSLPGPDHQASLEPDELQAMVKGIRDVEVALGDGDKQPAASELKNRPIVRKSLVAARPIHQGEVFSVDNLTSKRPGSGLSPMRYWEVLGQTASRDFAADEEITL